VGRKAVGSWQNAKCSNSKTKQRIIFNLQFEIFNEYSQNGFKMRENRGKDGFGISEFGHLDLFRV